MQTFSFSIPQNVIFGKGSLRELPKAAKRLQKSRAFIISGPHLQKMGMVEECRDALRAAGIESEAFTQTEGNPGTGTVERAAESYKSSGADFIVALGGGSPLDVAKAAGILAAYGGKITEYEGAGKVPGPIVPIIAVPTTAGTGSEVTPFSVITDHDRSYKLSVSSSYLLPACAILDPELIVSVPKETAAACGVDAMVHALEAYISLASSPYSDLFAQKALQLIGKSIRTYVSDRKRETEAMMLGSLFAGIAFSHARLGNVHAMSHPVSACFNVPHGVANAILLPAVVEYNAPTDQGKYYEIYRCIESRPIPEEKFYPCMLTQALRLLNAQLGIPRSLRETGVRTENFEAMAEDAMKSGNIAVNLRKTTKADVIELYNKAF